MKHVLTEIAEQMRITKPEQSRLILAALRDMEAGVEPQPQPQWTPSLADPALLHQRNALLDEVKQLQHDCALLKQNGERLSAESAALRKSAKEWECCCGKAKEGEAEAQAESAALAAENEALIARVAELEDAMKGAAVAANHAGSLLRERDDRIALLEDAQAEKARQNAAPIARIKAQDNTPDQPIPADDEDAPEPAPLIAESEAVKVADAIAPVVEAAAPKAAAIGPRAVSEFVTLHGFTFRAIPSVGKLLNRLAKGSATSDELVAAGVTASKDALSVLMIKARSVLKDATRDAVIIQSSGRRGVAGRYRIVDTRAATPAGTPSPVSIPSAQDEADAGAGPGQEADESGVGDGISSPPQSAPFVAPPEPEEVVPGPSIPEPAADEGVLDVALKAEPAIYVPPEAMTPPPALSIPTGKAIAVDVKTRRIATPRGVYKVDGAPLAKALELLARIEPEQVIGFDVIARKCGYRDAEVAKTALQMERGRLASHGVDLWMDRFNVRARRAEV